MTYTIVFNLPGCLPEMEPYEIEGNLAEALSAVWDEVRNATPDTETPNAEPDAWDRLLDEIERDRDNAANLAEEGVSYSMPDGYVIEATLTKPGLSDLDRAKIAEGFLPAATLENVESTIADLEAKAIRLRILAEKIKADGPYTVRGSAGNRIGYEVANGKGERVYPASVPSTPVGLDVATDVAGELNSAKAVVNLLETGLGR